MTNQTSKKIKIAALGDIHVRETSAGQYKDLFLDMSKNADIFVLCGDLCDLGLPSEAEILAAELRSCSIPVVGVLGNHDYESGQQDKVTEILTQAGMMVLDNEPFELLGVGFAGVKGFGGGFDKYMLGSFGETHIKDFVAEALKEELKLETQLQRLTTEKKVVALHYSPIRATIEDEPAEIWPFLGCSRLASPIDQYEATVAFHGHAHHGNYEGHTEKGTPVYNVSSPIMQKRNPKQPYAVIEV
jgi:uncharacterized protein